MNQQGYKKRTFEDAPLAFQIKMLDEKMTSIWNAELSAYGLTFSQFPVLIYLVKNQDHKVTQKELCEAVHVKHPTMIGLLDRLEEKDLVVRRRDEENHRFNRIALSERGLEMMQSFRLDRIRSDQQTVEGLSEAEMQELSRMLGTEAGRDGIKVPEKCRVLISGSKAESECRKVHSIVSRNRLKNW